VSHNAEMSVVWSTSKWASKCALLQIRAADDDWNVLSAAGADMNAP
jgi:hypothetical protein